MGRKMSRKKKIVIGVGIAAVAAVGIAGGLFVGKKLLDRRKANKSRGKPGSFGSREIDEGPDPLAPYRVENPKTFRETVPVPDAVALGLNYDAKTGASINLLAAAFDYQGANLGFIQGGGQLMSLFNNAIQHAGNSQADSIGDNENIIFDLRAIPPNCTSVLFGTYLVTPPSQGLPKASIHMLPMLRQENIPIPEAGTRGIEDDEEEEEEEEEMGQGGTRGIEDDDEDDLIRLYQDDLDSTTFGSQKGFVGGKLFRDQQGAWFFTPFRLPVDADAQFGLWPALEHYGKP
jgi:hypothetical protein